MKTLNFYDVTTKTKFNSSKYTKKKKITASGRVMYYAISISPSGNKSSRILSKADYNSK